MTNTNKNDDWDNHKLLILKTIANLENDYKGLENVFMTFRLQSQEEFHKFSSEIDRKLKLLSDDIVKLQVKVLLISSFSTIVITCVVQAIIKNLLN
jgi:hypothetical protein